MKILFIIDCLASGGKERRLMELMKSLKADPDIDFELVLMDENIHYNEVLDLGIKINYLVRQTRKDFSVLLKLFKICKIYRPDIIHVWDSMTAVYALPVCILLHIKNVNGMVVDSPHKNKLSYKPWLRARVVFPFANLIIGNSRAGLKAYKAPAKRSIVIYNGFNFERLKVIKSGEEVRKELQIGNEYVVGMVATYSDFKDYPTYFQAAQLLLAERKDIIFLAVGSKTDSELTSRNINRKYLTHFRLLGQKMDVESYINIMDIGVLATFTEGISNSILEYMAQGKPVIATSGGGTSEIIVDQRTGFLVNPSDPAELAQKIHILLNDSALRSEMGIKGKKRVQDFFTIEKMTSRYILEYNKLLSN